MLVEGRIENGMDGIGARCGHVFYGNAVYVGSQSNNEKGQQVGFETVARQNSRPGGSYNSF
jgi:hypothetical protein